MIAKYFSPLAFFFQHGIPGLLDLNLSIETTRSQFFTNFSR
jgi:hypothetical protein